MIAGGEWNDLIEVLALDPELVFAGRVASVFAAFEHGDDYDFDADWLGLGCGLGKEEGRINADSDQNQSELPEELVHEIPSLLLRLIGLLCCGARE